MSDNTIKSFAFRTIITAITLVLCLFAAEILLRVKNSDGKNYHIEMWKYSRDLKHSSDNPVLGHEHVPNDQAKLQNVIIRTNEKGMRGSKIPAAQNGQRRIMLLGSSATLGWGIKEEETMSSVLQERLGKSAVVMNAGIGNYNAQRYVELFLSKNTDMKPTDIIVNYYLNDAEILGQGGGNFIIRNSELAVTFWILFNRIFGEKGEATLLDHYKSIYEPDYQGLIQVKESLAKLAYYAEHHGINLYLMMMPEVHDLENYQYQFAHDIMAEIAHDNGYIYIDGLPALQNTKNTQDLWAMPGDPHPNAHAHALFADAIYPSLTQQK